MTMKWEQNKYEAREANKKHAKSKKLWKMETKT